MKESTILNNIPAALRGKDILVLEGIRYALGIIFESYETLYKELNEASIKTLNNKSLDGRIYYRLFKESWAIVDFGWKLRNLLIQIDHPNEEEVKAQPENPSAINIEFLTQLQGLRHTFQHLDERINEVFINENASVWGNLSWLYMIDNKKVFSCVLFPGHPRGSTEVVNPAGLLMKPPLDHIRLTSINRKKEKIKVNISELMQHLDNLMTKLEQVLKPQFETLNSKIIPQDMIIAAEITWGKTKHKSNTQ